jgi:hypothetical protein
MPFMQRITWSGIALHQGVVPGHPASHGCIRLTGDFAQYLFRTTKVGARVVIARTDVAPSEISSSRLFTPKPRPAVSEAAPAAPTRTAEAAITDAAPTPVKSDAASELKPSITLAADTPAAAPAIIDAVARGLDKIEAKKEMAPPRGPISVFISAKEKRLFVRQEFLPIFDAPITFKDGDRPLGTHVYTAMADSTDAAKLRWLAVSVPDAPKETKSERNAERSGRGSRETKAAAVETPAAATAAEALERFELPSDILARVEEMITVGASVTVTDHGLGDETGEGTDFIVVTR